MDNLPPIKGFLESSFNDWPGKMVAVLFLGGCNFHCPDCHHPILAAAPESLPDIPWTKVENKLWALRDWLDGVVITGGEPTLQANLPRLLKLLKLNGFTARLDTNGSQPRVLASLLAEGLVDAVAMDWKAPLIPQEYSRAAGTEVDVAAIDESRRIIINSRLPHIFRCTIWPAWHGVEEIRRMIRHIGSPHIVLQAGQRLAFSGLSYSHRQLRDLQIALATTPS
jgi:pyruvate formate lyase activating enzyme